MCYKYDTCLFVNRSARPHDVFVTRFRLKSMYFNAFSAGIVVVLSLVFARRVVFFDTTVTYPRFTKKTTRRANTSDKTTTIPAENALKCLFAGCLSNSALYTV